MLKYQSISAAIRDEIMSGQFPDGSMLPTEGQFAERFSVSRQTIRQALSILVQEGLIAKQRGSGSRVHLQAGRPRSGNIAVIATYISDYIFPGILREAEAVLAANKCTAILAATHNSIYNERTILTDFLNKPIDGILVEGTKTALPNPNLDLYAEFMERGVPIVFFNGYYTALGGTVAVYADNYGGGYELVRYLLQKGHQTIAGIFKSDDIQGHQRYSGYINALRDAGRMRSESTVLWYTTESREDVLTDETAAILANCSAVVCYNDEVAFRLVPLLQSAGLRVPQDVAVVSFDDSTLSEISPVKITSLSYGDRNIGRISAEKLMRLIAGEPAETQTLPWTLIEKGSSR